jgi:hypothetical protein
MNLRSEIFDNASGRSTHNKRTICEVLKKLYDLTYINLSKTNPELMAILIPLFEEAYIAGIKMTKRLVEYKVAMPEWEDNLDLEECQRIRALRIQLNKELARCDDLSIAVIINPKDYKFSNESYSKTYKDMLGALFGRFGTKRALERGIDYIVTPSVWGYNKYIAPHIGDRAEEMMLWFPPVPKKPKVISLPLQERRLNIICHGHTWPGVEGFRPYEFRRWAMAQKNILRIPHYVEDKNTPIRESYVAYLTQFRAGIAACEYYPVAKYFEIPLAGCVLFAQRCEDFDRLGFENGRNCIIVDKKNLNKFSEHFIKNYKMYQPVADAGKKFVEDNWTAEKFADHIYNHAREKING